MWRCFLRSEGFKPLIKHPRPGKPTLERWALVMPGFLKPEMLNSGRAGGLLGNQDPASKGLCTNPLSHRTSREAAVCKVPGSYIKEIYWLSLGCVLVGKGSVGTFLRDKKKHSSTSWLEVIISNTLHLPLFPCHRWAKT